MNVSACLVTRGDVDMSPVITSLTAVGIDDIVVYDNSKRENLAVYGRYAAIAEAKHDLIYVQDDDVIVSDPLEIVNEWVYEGAKRALAGGSVDYTESAGENLPTDLSRDFVVCNMPEAHRSQPFYKEHALVGFGAVFHRDAPQRAFEKFFAKHGHQHIRPARERPGQGMDGAQGSNLPCTPSSTNCAHPEHAHFHRRCDVLFTALTPRVLVDVPIRNLPYYDAPNRSWKQPNHFKERKKMLELALSVRDA